MPNSLAIIGAGRVGRALGRRLRELGWKLGAVVTRSEPSARRAVRFIGDGKTCDGMTRRILASRVILIVTPDDEITVVAQELARIGEEELRGRVVLHTSGAMYHTAAAMAAGHVLAVEEAATQLLLSLGMRRSEAVRALLPLTRQVLEKFETSGPRAAWTGPLSRGDFKVVQVHLEALQELPQEFGNVYAALSRLSARVLAQDTAGILAKLEKSSVEEKPKAKATGGNA